MLLTMCIISLILLNKILTVGTNKCVLKYVFWENYAYYVWRESITMSTKRLITCESLTISAEVLHISSTSAHISACIYVVRLALTPFVQGGDICITVLQLGIYYCAFYVYVCHRLAVSADATEDSVADTTGLPVGHIWNTWVPNSEQADRSSNNNFFSLRF